MAGAGFLQALGRGAFSRFEQNAGMFALLAAALRALPALAALPVRTVLYRQVYFTGIQALSRISLIGALIGIAILTQISSLVGKNAALSGRILVWVVVRELGPLLAAIVIISRSCSAATAELASMKVNRELEYLRALGIDALRYLIVPRVAGITLSVLALTVWFQAVTIVGGLALSSLVVQLPFLSQLDAISAALQFYDVSLSLLKSLIFGLVISAAACYHGIQAHSSITEVPQLTTRAVMQSLSLVVVADVLTTVLFFV